MASTGTMPNGSYQGTDTTTSAERISAGTCVRGTLPMTCTRSPIP